MWISKKKYDKELVKIKNEELFKSLDRESEILQERDIETLKKEVKRLKKKVTKLEDMVKNGY